PADAMRSVRAALDASVRMLLLAAVARVLDQTPPHLVGIPTPGGLDVLLDHRVAAGVGRRHAHRLAELVGVGGDTAADHLADNRFDYGSHGIGRCSAHAVAME